MSIIAIAWRAHPDFPLVLMMNHDDAHDSPTTPLAEWEEVPDCIAGKDHSGGTWLGITKSGRYAAVTAFRDGAEIDAALPPLGKLPVDYLASDENPVTHTRQFLRNRDSHPPFNLIVGSTRQAYYAGTRARLPLALTQGVHTVSNGLLDEKWPKCEQLNQLLGTYLKTYGGFSILLAAYAQLSSSGLRGADQLPKPAGELSPEDIAAAGFAMLADRTIYSEGLPDTGIDSEEEKRRSACFVIGEKYGTRSSSVISMSRNGKVRFEERCFDKQGEMINKHVETWEMDASVFSGGGD